MVFTLGKIANSVGLGKLSNSLNKTTNDLTNAAGKVTSEIMGNTVGHLRDAIDRKGGLARVNKFCVFMQTPNYTLFNKDYISVAYGLSNGYVQSFLDDVRDVGILCESVTMPGSTLNTFDYGLVGHSKKMVSGFSNTEFSIGFIVTNDFFIPKMFKGWEQSIVNRTTNRLKYKDSYTKDIRIICFDDNNIPNYGLKIVKAFPIQQSEMTFDENEMNTYQKYNVTFAYESFEEYDVADMLGDLSGAISSTLKGIGGLFENLNVSDSQKLFGSVGDLFQAQGNPIGTITSSSLPVQNNPFGTNLITDVI
jgi:hypothetical protein